MPFACECMECGDLFVRDTPGKFCSPKCVSDYVVKDRAWKEFVREFNWFMDFCIMALNGRPWVVESR